MVTLVVKLTQLRFLELLLVPFEKRGSPLEEKGE
jgi:hypothetical protein